MRMSKIAGSVTLIAAGIAIFAVPTAGAAGAAPRQTVISDATSTQKVIKSVGFAGYATGPGANIIKATIKVPQATCSSSTGQYYFTDAVGVLGPSGLTAGGANAYCVGSSLNYQAQVGINSGTLKDLFPIKPGDTITVTVSETVAGAAVTVKDLTSKATGTDTGTGDGVTGTLAGTFAAAPIPTFTKASFSNVTIGRTALGSNNPAQVEMVSGLLVLMAPSAISNGNAFTVLLKHS